MRPISPAATKLPKNLLSLNGGGINRNFGSNKNTFASWAQTGSAAGIPQAQATLSPPIIPSIPVIALLTILSFALSEILNFCGIFHDEHGIKAKEKADRFKEEHFHSDDLEETVDRIWGSAEKWWYKNRRRGGVLRTSTWRRKWQFFVNLYSVEGLFGTIHYLSFKHQFAVGCTVGMVFQKLTLATINVGFFVYVASEMLYNLRGAAEE